MIRRLLAPALLVALLAGCSRSEAPAPAATDAAAPAPVAETPAPAAPEPAAPADASSVAPAAAGDVAATPTASAAPPAAPTGPEPRLGTDYVVLESPQPLWSQAPKMEIAEVFSYRCIHCAEFQPTVNHWRPTMPADARWEYVPGVFGGAWDEFARAYFAAEVLGVRERTHDDVFDGVFNKGYIKEGKPEEIAQMYTHWGVDKARMLSTMQSFGVTAKLNRAKQFAMRTGVNSTPTIVVNGKYRVEVTSDRGFDGMLKTVEWLLARERAQAAAAPAATPAG